MSVHYYFLPSTRAGLAASIDAAVGDTAQRAGVTVTLTAAARIKGSAQTEGPVPAITQTVQLLGPGDIEGVDPRAVERTDPKPDVGDFEVDYFPAIEFVDADFAWRFTADAADANGRLTPWITLIVLVSEAQGDSVQAEFTAVPPQGRTAGHIVITDPAVLPNLEHAKRWAHVHIDGEPGLTKAGLEQLLEDEPERATCRLLCPRRLRAGTRYAAFVVPTFKLGVQAGLQEPLDPALNALALAWKNGDAPPITLPYYYRWDFRTSASGDFEQLVRRLEARPLSQLGIRDVDCATPGFGVPGVARVGDNHLLGLEGALRSVDTTFTLWGRDPADQPAGPVPDTQRSLAALVNLPNASLATNPASLTISSQGGIASISALGGPSETSLQLKWTTGADSTGAVTYWDNGVASQPIPSDPPVTGKSHGVTLSGLVPGKSYPFQISGQTAGGALAPASGTVAIPVPSVVPPLYGRCHYGRRSDVRPDAQQGWFDVLNLDPRHRLAAGFGAEVVRRLQEPLMASAWDQLGDADDVNGVLRRAQFGRETGTQLFRRLGQFGVEDLLFVTRSVQERVLVQDPTTGKRVTARAFASQSRIPAAVLDPAFRRIARRRGPLRARQGRPRSTNLLTRLATGALEAAGPPPVPSGTVRLCDISTRLRDSIVPTVTLTATPSRLTRGGKLTLKWSSKNCTSLAPGGAWAGTKGASGSSSVDPFASLPPPPPPPVGGGTIVTGPLPGGGVIPPPLPILQYQLTGKGPGGACTATVAVTFDPTASTATVIVVAPAITPAAWDPTSKRFCDGALKSDQLTTALAGKPFANATGYDPAPRAVIARAALDALDRNPAKDDRPPLKDATFTGQLRTTILGGLDPKKTFVARAKQRLTLVGSLGRRFDAGTPGDPLESLLFEPTFPQPMYEPLRDIAHELLLPGVEKIPQDTVSLLQTNRRFIEAYMCGLNHEFAGELLWREYPTDQRGSYFRQFWDVSEYVMSGNEPQQLLAAWLAARNIGNLATLTRDARVGLLRRNLAAVAESVARDLSAAQLTILKRLAVTPPPTAAEIADTALNDLIETLAIQDRLNEKLRDIARVTDWKDSPLGKNPPAAAAGAADALVFVVRGELLRRFPGASVYAVDAVLDPSGTPRPGLDEYLRELVGDLAAAVRPDLEATGVGPALRNALAALNVTLSTGATCSTVIAGAQWSIVDGAPGAAAAPRYDVLETPGGLRLYRTVIPSRPSFPIFKASLPPDLTFFGFPFTAADARAGNGGLGKYFVIEERPGEPRFGLDTPTKNDLNTWDDLSWTHFDLDEGVGTYLDAVATPKQKVKDDEGRPWDPNNTSATRAWITLQRPVRVAVHAKQMLP